MHGAQLVAWSPSMREALLGAKQRQVWWQIVILVPRRWRQENKKFKVIVRHSKFEVSLREGKEHSGVIYDLLWTEGMGHCVEVGQAGALCKNLTE